MEIKYLFGNILSLLLTALFLKVSEGHHCTNTHIAYCRKQRDDHFKNITNSNDVTYNLIHMTEQHLEIYCSYYNSTIKACYADLRQHCSTDLMVKFIGYEESTTYLCNDNYWGFLNVQGCLSRSEVSKEMVICKAQYDHRLANTKSNNEEFCRATETFKQCNADVVRLHCNSDAVDWIKTFNGRMYRAEMDYKQCGSLLATTTTTTTISSTLGQKTAATTSQEGGMESWLIAVIAGVILLVLSVVIIAAVVITCRYRHDKDENMDSDDRHTNVTVNVISGYHHQPRSHRHDKHKYQGRHSGSRHGSSGSIHTSSGSVHTSSGYSSRHIHNDVRYIEGDRKGGKKNKYPTNGHNEIKSEYLEPARYSVEPTSNFTNRPPSLGDISRNGSGKEGRSLNRYPSNDGSEYTQLTTSSQNQKSHSVLGYENNTYEELPQ